MAPRFQLGSWLVHPDLNAIVRNGTIIHLTPKAMGVLVCLAEHADRAVSREKLIQTVWADTFVTDDVLKGAVSELRRALEDDAREPRIIETIPKRGYRMIAAVEPITEEPVEITPGLRDHQRHPEGLPRSQAQPARAWSSPRRRWQFVISATLLVALVVTFVASRNYFRGDESSVDSIAVMPFASKGTETGAEFADSLTSGLIESLSQIPQLRVMSRSSVTRYKGQDIDLRRVGRELNVHAVLTGTLTPRGDGFVLDAELVNTSDNSHLWGQQYITNPDDVLALQAHLVREVSTKLRPSLTPESKARLASPGTSNPEAYSLYVKGRYSFDRWEPQHTKDALVFFQQAVEKDPTYAEAYAGMGDAYAILTYFAAFPLEQGIRKAKGAARKALQLDANLAEGHCALGAAAYIHLEWALAESEDRLCVELNPNLSYAHQWLAWALASLGRMEQSVAEEKLALQVDPLSHTSNKFLAVAYYHSRDYERAIEQTRKWLEVEPNAPDLHDDLATWYLTTGDYAKSESEYEKALTLKGRSDQAERLRRAYAQNGYQGLLHAQIELWSDPKRAEDYDPFSVAENYSLLGDSNRAFLWLDKSYEWGPLLVLKTDPQLDNIRSDPRFKALLQRVGLVP